MKWSEISIHTTQEAVEPVSHILHDAGAGGVVIEDRADYFRERESRYGEIFQLSADDYPETGVLIKAYLPESGMLEQTIGDICASVTKLKDYGVDIGANEVAVSEVDEEEWSTAWKKYYKPEKVGTRITVSPSWENYEPEQSDEVVVELDPGMAFGTGTHPTTVLCLQALEKRMVSGIHMMDVGTGSGVLAIAAAKLGASVVDAVDLDPVAVKAARENVQFNQTEQVVRVSESDLLSGAEGTYDLVTANILADIIVSMVPDAKRAVKPGGHLIVSGIIEKQRDQVRTALMEAGFVMVETTEMENWTAFTVQRPEED
ncbi:50S ribosomal protein L11 methyltransferase [Alkalicoccus chagannorensis]|uniref:50S ribosomal protein L11 methyltransferase n=1 Tax=Alkalicoccus chagannorensis TaxID=427072 RepID=UPI00041A3046|nr:50S ribosomal protein L11 methyltransferase [Alkalicoccus chagannorensis]